jgi:NAD-dependent deacetylase
VRELHQAARALARSQRVVALTGAGVSAESGVPTFRGPGGLWRNYRPEDLATPEAFARDPALVWEWYQWRQGIVAGCQPNPGHLALVEMEAEWPDFTLVTQNVDGLHRRAGSRRLLELHGNLTQARCTREGRVVDLPRARGLPRCPCGALLRPHVVWFGEALDPQILEAAFQASRTCQVFLSIGTSALVAPASTLPLLAHERGAVVVEINPQPTALPAACLDVVLRGPSGEILPRLLAEARRLRG